MDSNEVYSPPSSIVEDKLQEPKARKFAMALVAFVSGYAGIMLFFLMVEMANSKPADFIFETGFQIASVICAALTAALLYPIRSIAWYFQAMIASISGLVMLAALLFILNAVLG